MELAVTRLPVARNNGQYAPQIISKKKIFPLHQ